MLPWEHIFNCSLTVERRMLSEEAGPVESVGTGRQQRPRAQSEASECGFRDVRVPSVPKTRGALPVSQLEHWNTDIPSVQSAAASACTACTLTPERISSCRCLPTFKPFFLLLELLAFSFDLENPQHVSTEITCFICTTEKEARNGNFKNKDTKNGGKKPAGKNIIVQHLLVCDGESKTSC